MNQKQGRKFRKWLANSVKVLVLVLFLLWTVVPILLVILTSLKNQKDIFTVPPTFVFRPTLDNYSRALIAGDFARYFLNSALVAAVSSFLSVGFGTFCAYALVSLRVRFASLIANLFLLGKLVPAITMLLPLFAILNTVRLLGTYVGPILAHTAVNLPFVIWLIMGFIRDMPEDLEAAALVDGCTPMQTFWKIVVPIILPGLAASTILSAQFSWNELLFALQLTNLDTYTLPVGISKFVGSISVDWGKSSAAATLTMVPMIIIGFFIQKYIAKGTTGGAVKG
ncbi:MAG TPA: carbohydrate ABC transporter permease [Chthoniobacterales bacterium]|jgi:multiple sugar transport system permease protein|nr:carbohydrate ABC transporter permease [Chthoniobacterales bacterium]